MKNEQITEKLTCEEKAAFLQGTAMWTNAVQRLDIPSVKMSDGPHGLRVQKESGENGISENEPATCFPTAATTAAGWNEQNLYNIGQAIADECLHYGINIALGPGVCIKRNPLCGRNFEYFSEDPLLAGKMGAAEVKGIQSKNIGVAVKHFALNNAENFRIMGNSVCDERAMREIYLKAFEIIVKEASPHTVMCSYNAINGEYCSENKWLLTDVLRNEWGFDGLVMSDWGATHDRIKGIKAGLDLEMPGGTAICRKWVTDGVKNGSLSVEQMDIAVNNIFRLTQRYKENPKGTPVDWEAHNRLSAEIAEDCAVLLKNDGVLPLNSEEKILVTGDFFNKMRYQGAGSSMIKPTFLTTPETAFIKNGVKYEFCEGYEENKLEASAVLIEEAVEKAKNYDKILVFAGLTDYVECEGFDRENMRLPENQLALIDALVKTGKKVIVVLFGGSPMEVPFENGVSAILDMYLPGQNGGTAAYNLIFGKKSPCGKLAETWAEKYDDIPFGKDFSKEVNEIYKESVFVGYRYFLTAGKKVRYPFGYGLSYTTFEYGDMRIDETATGYNVRFSVKNTGDYDGAEIAQLYVKAPDGVFKPLKELKGFTKIYLKKGEIKEASINVNKGDISYFNVKERSFVTEAGEYEFQICSDCETVKLSATVKTDNNACVSPYTERVNDIYKNADMQAVTDNVFEEMSGLKIPELPPKKPIRLNSRFTDLKSTFFGKIIFNAVISVAKKEMKKAKKMPDGAEKDNKIKNAVFLKHVLESNSINMMTMSAGKSFPFNYAEGMMHIANGKIFKGIKCFCTKIKTFELPKDKESK